MADELAVIRSLHTDAINHEPAILLMNSGNMVPGKPSIGSWISYGLGSMNEDLPTFVVLTSKLQQTTYETRFLVRNAIYRLMQTLR
jgi:hypothetical protein